MLSTWWHYCELTQISTVRFLVAFFLITSHCHQHVAACCGLLQITFTTCICHERYFNFIIFSQHALRVAFTIFFLSRIAPYVELQNTIRNIYSISSSPLPHEINIKRGVETLCTEDVREIFQYEEGEKETGKKRREKMFFEIFYVRFFCGLSENFFERISYGK